MSLLVDLLSKTKTEESRKDIPPDLRRTVVDGTYKRKSRRKVIFLSIVVLIIFLAGFGTIYVMEIFKTSLSTTIAAKIPTRQPVPSSTIRDEKPTSSSNTDIPVNVATVAPKVFFRVTSPQVKPQQPASVRSPKVVESLTRENEPTIPSTSTVIKTQVPGKGKATATEILSTEKAQQKTNKDVHLFAARTHEAKGEFKQALDSYLKALELDPTNYVIMNNISGIYIRLKLFSEALSYASRALVIKTNYSPSLINAGIAHVSLGNLTEGEGFLARAATLDPLNRVALFNLAVLCEKQGNYDKAFENYYKLSQMRDVDGCLGAARILERQGRNSETARFYREILAIETASPSVRQFANQRLSQLSQ
jgi:Tfp pilus assembly protein PilF